MADGDCFCQKPVEQFSMSDETGIQLPDPPIFHAAYCDECQEIAVADMAVRKAQWFVDQACESLREAFRVKWEVLGEYYKKRGIPQQDEPLKFG